MNIETLSQHLLDITKEKYNLLKELHALTSKQAEVISDKQLTGFLSICTQKQEVIKKINALDVGFEKQYDLLKTSTNASVFIEVFSKQKALKELQSTVIQITRLIETITDLELQNKDIYKKVLTDIMVSINQSAISRSEQILRYKKMNNYKKHL
ncbi:MAG: flagellar export chaperone FlgN [Clostridia bacterium]